MLTVTKTADDDTADFFVLPGDLSGTVYVRVVDTDRTAGNNVLDRLYIDSLFIVCETAATPPAAATDPDPADDASGVPINPVLTWTPSLWAASHDVYFGVNPVPGAAEFQGNQVGSSYVPGSLAADTTYYWAIDGVNSVGIAAGPVWSFTTGGATLGLHVAAIDLGIKRKAKDYRGEATVTVVDSGTGQPLAGATVQGDFSGAFSESASAVTDTSGQAVLTTGNRLPLPFSFTFTVSDVAAAGYLYLRANNVETSDSGSF